jgi:hypothetical protein
LETKANHLLTMAFGEYGLPTVAPVPARRSDADVDAAP